MKRTRSSSLLRKMPLEPATVGTTPGRVSGAREKPRHLCKPPIPRAQRLDVSLSGYKTTPRKKRRVDQENHTPIRNGSNSNLTNADADDDEDPCRSLCFTDGTNAKFMECTSREDVDRQSKLQGGRRESFRRGFVKGMRRGSRLVKQNSTKFVRSISSSTIPKQTEEVSAARERSSSEDNNNSRNNENNSVSTTHTTACASHSSSCLPSSSSFPTDDDNGLFSDLCPAIDVEMPSIETRSLQQEIMASRVRSTSSSSAGIANYGGRTSSITTRDSPMDEHLGVGYTDHPTDSDLTEAVVQPVQQLCADTQPTAHRCLSQRLLAPSSPPSLSSSTHLSSFPFMSTTPSTDDRSPQTTPKQQRSSYTSRPCPNTDLRPRPRARPCVPPLSLGNIGSGLDVDSFFGDSNDNGSIPHLAPRRNERSKSSGSLGGSIHNSRMMSMLTPSRKRKRPTGRLVIPGGNTIEMVESDADLEVLGLAMSEDGTIRALPHAPTSRLDDLKDFGALIAERDLFESIVHSTTPRSRAHSSVACCSTPTSARTPRGQRTPQRTPQSCTRSSTRRKLYHSSAQISDSDSGIGPLPTTDEKVVMDRLMATIPNWDREEGSTRPWGQLRKNYDLEYPDNESTPYADHFYGKDHYNILGVDKSGAVMVISLLGERGIRGNDSVAPIRVLVQQTSRGGDVFLPIHGFAYVPIANVKMKSTSYSKQDGHDDSFHVDDVWWKADSPIIKKVMDDICPKVEVKKLWTVATRSQHTSLSEKLLKFEKDMLNVQYKFGVMYVAPGQTDENVIFGNDFPPPESSFHEFLAFLGDKIVMKEWNKFRGGLDVKSDSTGTHSVYTEHRGQEIMYHVTPMLPYQESDEQKVERKRHIGNDIVVIVFNESGLPYVPDTITSNFNHVTVVVTPVSEDCGVKYRVAVSSKSDVPQFGPPLPVCGDITELNDFTRHCFITKLINAERAALEAPEFRRKLKSTRDCVIKDLVESFPKTKAK